jgi:dTDP-4-amino-4,6-dideoxygalactose transaminase
MSELPDLTEAEPIPQAALDEIGRLCATGDLFRYTDPASSPAAALERAFADALDMPYALAVSSCSAALFLALKALALPRGTGVVLPGFTFAAVPSAVLHADCRPILCEVGDDYRIDLADFEARLDGAGAVLISHMRGHTSDMDLILALAEDRGLPVIEDAAHSLGTTWRGARIGTLGHIGCFSFQSYKLLNAGEGGMFVTRDPDLLARAVIMSGAYERNWQSHAGVETAFRRWQNRLPLYNLRMSNLSAAAVLPQVAEIADRAARGLRNHDLVAARLSAAPAISVPRPLAPERRAPDSIQFNLVGLSDHQVDVFLDAAQGSGLPVQIFGKSRDNARAFWNWEFLPGPQELPRTRAMLMRACDLRLPARLTEAQCHAVADRLLDAASRASAPVQVYGT